MADIVCNNIGKYFGEAVILKGVSFEIFPGQHVGLIGANGTGKSSLFRILSGEWTAEEGTFSVAKNKKLGLLSQLPEFAPGATVEDVLREAFAEKTAMLEQMHELEEKMTLGTAADTDLKRYGELSARFEASGGYDADVALAKVAAGLNVTELLPRPFANISGGEQTRANLARLILADTDILLLDEPTNHLDIRSVEWLEQYISGCKNTVVVVSHDRWFLDRTVTRILELEDHTVIPWEGNYSAYMAQKEQWIAETEKLRAQEQRKIDQLEYTAARMHGWATNNTKMARKWNALAHRIERLKAAQTAEIHRDSAKMKGGFGEAAESGTEVLTISGLSKSFGERTLFSGAELAVRKGDGVAILGDNGTGKTTLLRILLGEEPADGGRIRWGANLKRAYLPQVVHFENEALTLVDTVCAALKLTPPSARNRLGAYQFRGDEVFKPVSALSGGEKSRLALCILMYNEVNLLILDEPTNHLDIKSREWLESALENFEGTLMFVSHDRYFISRFATRVWHLEDARITDFPDSYERFEEIRKREEALSAAKPKPETAEAPAKTSVNIERRAERFNLKQDRKRLAALEREIAVLENRQKENAARQEASACEPEALLEAMQEGEALQAQLAPLYDEWAELSERISEESGSV